MGASIVMALAAGAAVAIQAAVNSGLSRTLAAGIGAQPLVAATLSFLVGTALLLLLCALRTDSHGAWTHIPQVPWWQWLGGTLGAGFVLSSVFLAPRLGIANMLFFMLLGQLLTATLLDHFGLLGVAVRPTQWRHVLGLALMGAGLAVFFFGHKLLGNGQ